MNCTRGEWKYDPSDNESYQDKNKEGQYKGVITGGKENLILAVMISDCLEDKVMSNALLMAAAPAMYEALKAIKDLCNGYTEIDRETTALFIDRILSKAGGETL